MNRNKALVLNVLSPEQHGLHHLELVRNANSRASSKTTELETPGVGPNSLRCTQAFWMIVMQLQFGKRYPGHTKTHHLRFSLRSQKVQ